MLRSILRKIRDTLSPSRRNENPMTLLDRLKQRGLVVGKNLKMQHGVVIDSSHCWHIEIGDDVTLAPFVHILAHDASTKLHLGYTRIGKVVIGHRVFIGASSIILPGVSIGPNVIIGAGSVVTHSVVANVVAAGNPARVICTIDEYIEKKKTEMGSVPCFGEEYSLRRDVSDKMKNEMNDLMIKRFGYID